MVWDVVVLLLLLLAPESETKDIEPRMESRDAIYWQGVVVLFAQVN